MLVLSRKADDAIVFPNLGITVKLLRLNKQVARIGIDAPEGVRILREELNDGSSSELFDKTAFDAKIDSSLSKPEQASQLHQIRNRLNTINLGLQFYKQQMDAGLTEQAHVTFLRILDELQHVESEVGEKADEEDKRLRDEAASLEVPVRLLLVEDDPNQRELLAGVLRMRGCEVATAVDGDDALDYLSNNDWPDYLLMDMRMPRRDGASTIQQVLRTKMSPDLKILAISGSSPDEFDRHEAIEGIDQWFPKPVNTESLIRYMSTPRSLMTDEPNEAMAALADMSSAS